MLFGLVSATNYLLGRLERNRDFEETASELRLRGSESSIGRSWFERREASATPVDAGGSRTLVEHRDA